MHCVATAVIFLLYVDMQGVLFSDSLSLLRSVWLTPKHIHADTLEYFIIILWDGSRGVVANVQ